MISTGEILRLVTIEGAARFQYVARDTLGVRWLNAWGRSVTAPFAVVIEGKRDTIVLVIGDRG